MLIKYTCFEDFIVQYTGSKFSIWTWDSLQELFFNEDHENELEKEKRGSMVSQAVEEWCKCKKYETMITEKKCRCCHKAASHYLNGNVRGGSRIFSPSKLEIFATNDSRLPDASDCHRGLHGRCYNFWVSTFIESY